MAVINLATSALAWGWPVLLAFAATPFIVKGLGNDGYGIRGLVSSITGYFALLDLGLNGAVTKYLAEYRAKNDRAQIVELLGTTLTTFTALGVIGGLVIFFLAEWFTKHLFTIPPSYYSEAVLAFRLTGLGFFLSMLTWWGSSIAPGLQRFDVFNGISIGFGTITTLGMVIAVKLGYGLVGVVVANLFANAAAALAYWISSRKLMPEIPVRFSFDNAMFRRTFMFGIYMVAFRVFGLLFSQLDSVIIGAWAGTAALTFYLVPQQVAQLVHGINGKMLQIVAPMASEFSVMEDPGRMERLFIRGFNLSLVIGLSIAIPLFVVSGPLLRYWVSPEMALQSSVVLKFLIVAFFLAGLTSIPVNVLTGIALPQFVTLGAVISGLFGALSYWMLVKPFGILGVAIGKVFGVTVTIIYYIAVCHWKARYSLRALWMAVLRISAVSVLVGLPAYYIVPQLISSLISTVLAVFAIFIIYSYACWVMGIFDQTEKRSLLSVGNKFLLKFGIQSF
jgi:O-antigen/teichoic acid export membrane protein